MHLVWGLWDDGPLPDMWARNVARWTELNPTWTTRLWRRADCEKLASTKWDWKDTYFSSRPIQRADLVRLMIVWKHGGLYADLDVVPKMPLDRALKAFGFFYDVDDEGGDDDDDDDDDGPDSHYSTALFVETRLPAWYSVETSRWPIRRGKGEVRVRVANFLFSARPGSPVLARALDIATSRLLLMNGPNSDLRRYSNSEYAIIYSSGPDVLSEAAMRAPDGTDMSGRANLLGRFQAADATTLLIPLLDFMPFASHGHAATWEGESNPAIDAPPDQKLSKAQKKRDERMAWAEEKRFTLRLGRFTVKVDSLEELLDTFTSSLATESVAGGGFYHYLRTAIRKLKDAAITDTTSGGEGAAAAADSQWRFFTFGATDDNAKWFVPHLVDAYSKFALHDTDMPGRARHELGKVFMTLGMPGDALEALKNSRRDLEAVSSTYTSPDLHVLWNDIAGAHLATVQDESSLLSVPALEAAVQAFEEAIAHAPLSSTDPNKPPPIFQYRRSLAVAQELRRRLPPSVAIDQSTSEIAEKARQPANSQRRDL